jgi:hypothetical protein
MRSFVEECRREWRRLGVADAAANEMASELEADLAEAEADGVSPEEVLGRGVFDARAFAASWAAERGLVPAQVSPPAHRFTLPTSVIVALALLLALVVAGLALIHVHAGTSVAATSPRGAFVQPPGWRVGGPSGPIVVAPAVATLNGETSLAGVTLLVLGIVGIVLALLAWAVVARTRQRY